MTGGQAHLLLPDADVFGCPAVFEQRLWLTAFRDDTGCELSTLDLRPCVTGPTALFQDDVESGGLSQWSTTAS